MTDVPTVAGINDLVDQINQKFGELRQIVNRLVIADERKTEQIMLLQQLMEIREEKRIMEKMEKE